MGPNNFDILFQCYLIQITIINTLYMYLYFDNLLISYRQILYRYYTVTNIRQILYRYHTDIIPLPISWRFYTDNNIWISFIPDTDVYSGIGINFSPLSHGCTLTFSCCFSLNVTSLIHLQSSKESTTGRYFILRLKAANHET